MFITLVKENEESNSYHSSMKDFENIFKMSFLANSYVCISVFSHPYNFSSPGLLGSFLISFYILRSVLHTTSSVYRWIEWTTTIQRHFPQQQLNQVRRTTVTEQWTLHCWDVRPNVSCSSRWSKKIKNQISIAPVRRMSFLADSYVCVSVFGHPCYFSSAGLLGSFLISLYILRSVLHTTPQCTDKESLFIK